MTTMERAKGKTLYASEGERLGEVEMIFDDVQTRKPEWFAIGTAGTGGKRLLVPVEGADVRDDGIFVRYSAEQVRATPEAERMEISQETERRLYSHYGLPYSERRSATGLPERPKRGEMRRQQQQQQRRGGRTPKQRRDEPTRAELYEEAKRLDIQGRSKMNKGELLRAVERTRGSGESSSRRSAGRGAANPIEVQKFLEGVNYPAGTGELVKEAERQGAKADVRSTLEQLPQQQFDSPTEVSEAIGKLS